MSSSAKIAEIGELFEEFKTLNAQYQESGDQKIGRPARAKLMEVKKAVLDLCKIIREEEKAKRSK